MERHVSCINTKAVIDFFDERAPVLTDSLIIPLKSFFPEIHNLKAFLSDPHNWVSTDVLIALYEEAKKLFNNEDVVFDIGFESVAKHRLGYIQRILFFGFRNHARTIRKVQSLNDKFNACKTVEVVSLTENQAVIRLKWFRDIRATRDFCLMNRGVYTAVPVVWSEPPCHLEEHKCYFEGDDYCEYHVSWQRTRSVKRFLLGAIAPWRLAKNTIKELEHDKELLREKYAEVHHLNSQLKSQLDRLVSFNQAGTAILSTLDINELLGMILGQLLDVSILDRAAIFLIDEQKERLFLAHAVGADGAALDQLKNYHVSLNRDSNIIARVARTGEPEVVDDIATHNINQENLIIKQFHPKAFIVLPLNVRGRVIGVLVGDQEQVAGHAISEEKSFLTGFSNQIAIAIHNANLYHKLEQSEQKYRELIENAHEGIWVVDENGVINFANDRLAEMLGYQEMLGKNITDLVPVDRKKMIIRLLLENIRGKGVQEEFLLVGKGGVPISAIVSSVPIMDRQIYKGSFAMVTDITDKKLMEAQILHQQKMESIGTMAGGIAHDFNNILTAVLGNATLLKYHLHNNQSLSRYVEIIETSSMRAADLVRQLLAFSRGTEPEDLQIVYPNRIIKETLTLLNSSLGKDIRLALDLQNELPPIEGNATQIQQVLINLCLNARDAMPDGGRIAITTSSLLLIEHKNPYYKGLTVNPGQYVCLRVEDTGKGIPKSNLNKIFDPFFTTKEVGAGSGLGLTMVYGIVKNANGHLHVESEENGGTAFELLFPAASDPEETTTLDHGKPSLAGTETILLVDDEEFVRELGNEILHSYGYTVVLASDGQEALNVYNKRRSEIDLVILDLLMPNLNGSEAMKRLKTLDPSVKVIICSGYGARENPSDPLAVPNVHLVTKPFKPEVLAAAVRQVLDVGETCPGFDGEGSHLN